MDLSNSAATATVKTPEAENETPTRIQATNSKPLSFTNGVLKRHPPLQLCQANFGNYRHHPVVVNYKECLKNHAASLGRHAVDGCGEFMPSPTANPSEPTSLKCAACGCHRNFHRREPEDPIPPNAAPALEYQPHHRHHPPPPPPANRGNSSSGPNSPSPPPISSSYYPSAPHMLLALSHGPACPPPESGGTPMSTTPHSTSGPISSNPNGRKRFRTRFTQDQKDKMLHFAERVGWKMQKREEDAITEFCSEIGVDKGVFKVWMHNNKTTFGKRDQQISNSVISPTAPSTNNGNGNGIGYGTIGSRNNTFEASATASTTPSAVTAAVASSVPYHHHHHHHPHHQQQDGNGDSKINIHGQDLSQHHLRDNSGNSPRHVLGTNGSSSSS